MQLVYKMTYPNRKIYVGQDVTDSINYFGSPKEALVKRDFPMRKRQKFTVTREILWKSRTATRKKVNAKEREFIIRL